MKWELLERTACYRGHFRLDQFRVRHSLYGGGWSEPLTRELLERSDAVAVLPYDPVRDEVVLIEQFRIGAVDSPQGPWLMEIVAGLIEAGETGAGVAQREAREEAGCELEDLIHVYDYYSSPGAFKERVSVYLAKVDASRAGGIHGVEAEGEDIRVQVMPAEEAFAMLDAGLVTSAMPLIALQWLQLHRDDVRQRWCW